jgi:flavin-dependent dehydrogenase
VSAQSLIEIVGAGPAGLAAAITAARGGARVVVHERAARVGSRFHGDFQGLENWTTEGDVLEELVALGLRADFAPAPFRHQVCYDPAGGEHHVRALEPFYYLLRRGPDPGTLDHALWRQAEEAGVNVRFGSAVRQLPRGGIFAAGPRRGDVVAAGWLFESDLPDGAWTVLGETVAPGGYAYLLVHGGRATLSACLFHRLREARAGLARARAFLERRLGLVLRDPRPFGGIGNTGLPRTAIAGDTLLAGEAAGFQDPLWGFGIRHAILSGHLAARALLAGRPREYDRMWRRRLAGTIRASMVNRWFYGRLGDRGYHLLLRALGGAADPRAWLRRRYAYSPRKRLLFPLLRPGGAATIAPALAPRRRAAA